MPVRQRRGKWIARMMGGVPILMVLLLMHCAPKLTHIPESFTASRVDLSDYAAKGFLFSPSEYLGDFEAIGWVRVEYSPEANLVEVESNNSGGVQYGTRAKGDKVKSWKIEPVHPLLERAYEELYRQCTAMGADALTMMETTITEVQYPTSGPAMNEWLSIDKYRIDGFAIKRLGAFK